MHVVANTNALYPAVTQLYFWFINYYYSTAKIFLCVGESAPQLQDQNQRSNTPCKLEKNE